MNAIARAWYRPRQFFRAVAASLAPLSKTGQAEVWAHLPEAGRPLFAAMPRPDQRHGLEVLRMLRAAGQDHPALMQAALLHDCAKSDGVQLWHRVAVVLLKAFWPGLLARWTVEPAPPRGNWRYPFWVHANHPRRGAELAAAAGCDPLAVELIRRHQEPPGPSSDRPLADRLLAALQAADDDN